MADPAAFADEIVVNRIVMEKGADPIAVPAKNMGVAMRYRDAICKCLFETVFKDIVEQCNHSVAGQKESAKGRVGILDIFGFERMTFNSLEQLCINYTNEKLHQTFIDQVFEGEKRVYRDGLDDSAINFTDNAMVLEMVSGHNPHDQKNGLAKSAVAKKVKVSLIGILEDVCKMQKNTGETYCERVKEKWNVAEDANGPLFHGPKGAAEAFTVVHFAGPVEYGTTAVDKQKFLPRSQWDRAKISPDCPTIDDFVDKNRDNIPQSLLDFFTEKSSNGYFGESTKCGGCVRRRPSGRAQLTPHQAVEERRKSTWSLHSALTSSHF